MFYHPFFDTFAQCLISAPRLRRWIGWIGLLLFGCFLLAGLVNPLQRGLTARYYDNPDWKGTPLLKVRERAFTRLRLQSDFPQITENYGVQWTGAISLPAAGTYEFATISDDGSELWINDQLVVDNRGMHGMQERRGAITLDKGLYPVVLRYMQGGGGADLKVFWTPPGKPQADFAEAPLFAHSLTPRRFLMGRMIAAMWTVSAILLLAYLMIGLCLWFSSRKIVRPALAASRAGQRFQRWWAWLFPAVPAQALPEPTSKQISPYVLAFFGYIVLSLLWTYPLILKFSTDVFGLGGDRYIYLWDMWWMKKALVDLKTNPFFTNYVFYPHGVGLGFHDFTIFNALVSVPLQAFFTVEEIYNLLFLSSFVFGGFGCFVLLRYLTGSGLAAFLSGLVFAFWGGRMYHVDHLSLNSFHWFPYCAFYLLKTVREQSYRNPILAAVFLAMNALSAWYYAIYMTLFTGLFLLYTAWTERAAVLTMRNLLKLVVLGAVFGLLMLPVMFPMLRDIAAGEDYMASPVIMDESASLNTVFLPSVNHPFLGKYARLFYLKHDFPMQWGLTGGSFIGYTVLLLCLYAGFKLRRLKLGFWLLAAVIFLLLAFGPYFMLFSKHYMQIPLPYLLLLKLPILKIIRVPVRFMALVMFCCAVLAGYATWDILRKVRLRKTVFVLLSALILFEAVRFYYMRPVETAPELYRQLGQDTEDYAILELTQLMKWTHASVRAPLFQIQHGKKLFHGHSSRMPFEAYHQAYGIYSVFGDFCSLPLETLAQMGANDLSLGRNKETILAVLAFYNVRYVALYGDFWYGGFGENIERLKTLFGEPVSKEFGIWIFKAPPVPVTQNIIFPGFGMWPPEPNSEGQLIREASRSADIKLINVTGAQTVEMRLQAQSKRFPQAEPVQIFVNDTLAATVTIGDWTDVTIPPMPITAGENTIKFRMTPTAAEEWKMGLRLRNFDVQMR